MKKIFIAALLVGFLLTFSGTASASQTNVASSTDAYVLELSGMSLSELQSLYVKLLSQLIALLQEKIASSSTSSTTNSASAASTAEVASSTPTYIINLQQDNTTTVGGIQYPTESVVPVIAAQPNMTITKNSEFQDQLLSTQVGKIKIASFILKSDSDALLHEIILQTSRHVGDNGVMFSQAELVIAGQSIGLSYYDNFGRHPYRSARVSLKGLALTENVEIEANVYAIVDRRSAAGEYLSPVKVVGVSTGVEKKDPTTGMTYIDLSPVEFDVTGQNLTLY